MRRAVLLLAALVGVVTPAPARGEERSMTAILGKQVSLLGEQLALKLDVASFGDGAPGLVAPELDLQLDLRTRRARVRLGGGDDRVLALRLDARVVLDRGLPRVKGTLDLGVAGKRLTLSLPEVVIRPRTYAGEVYLEYSVPILEGRF